MSAAALANIAELEALIAAMKAHAAKMRAEVAGNDNSAVLRREPPAEAYADVMARRLKRGGLRG